MGSKPLYCKVIAILSIEAWLLTSFFIKKFTVNSNCLSNRFDLTTLKETDLERLRESNRALFRFNQFSQNSKMSTNICQTQWTVKMSFVLKSSCHWNRRTNNWDWHWNIEFRNRMWFKSKIYGWKCLKTVKTSFENAEVDILIRKSKMNLLWT